MTDDEKGDETTAPEKEAKTMVILKLQRMHKSSGYNRRYCTSVQSTPYKQPHREDTALYGSTFVSRAFTRTNLPTRTSTRTGAAVPAYFVVRWRVAQEPGLVAGPAPWQVPLAFQKGRCRGRLFLAGGSFLLPRRFMKPQANKCAYLVPLVTMQCWYILANIFTGCLSTYVSWFMLGVDTITLLGGDCSNG